MPESGKLILVLGTSSSGKSSTCALLQRRLKQHYLLTGTDKFFEMVNPDWGGGNNGPLSAQGFAYERHGEEVRITYGDEGRRVLVGITEAIRGMLQSGVNVIYDEMLLTEEHWGYWGQVRADFPTLVILLHADSDILLKRERSRGRKPEHTSLALGHISPNSIPNCDLRIDTSNKSLEMVADEILSGVPQ